jgi:sulfite reductase (ferredoxin)
VSPEDAVDLGVAIVKTQRDFGNRTDRKRARLKYLVHDWGIDRFREAVEQHYGRSTLSCTEHDVHGFDDHLGWQAQGDGRWTYGLNVENGRLSDNDQRQWKAMIRAVARQFGERELRLTAHQSLLFCDFADDQRSALENAIKQHGIPLSEEISEVRRWSMACVGLPTCGLSVTESERVLPSLIDQLEGPLAKLGLQREAFTIRMTGCPNGCARPYNADIGLVGKTKGKYTVFLGGRLLGTRLGYIFKDLVPFEQLASSLVEVFTAYKLHRQPEESVGDFCERVGKDQLLSLVTSQTA